MAKSTAPPGNGSTSRRRRGSPPNGGSPPDPPPPSSPADVIALGRLAASVLAAGRSPRPRQLLALAMAPRGQPVPGEPDLPSVVASLDECTRAARGAVAALSAKTVSTLAAADVEDRAAAVVRAITAMAIGDASDAPMLLESLADGLDVLAYPLDAPIAGCPGRDPEVYCGRIVPRGDALCRGCKGEQGAPDPTATRRKV